MTSIFYGEISDAWELDWGKGDDPFDVLKKQTCIDHFFFGGGVFAWAEEHCTDEVKVDWGSYAWKCKGRDLIELNNRSSTEQDPAIAGLDPDKTYGVVLIEMY